MIILRHKEFSLAATRHLAGILKRVPGKTSYQAKRAAIKTQNKVIGKTAKVVTKLEEAALNPGGATRKITKTVVENPLTTATIAAPLPGTSLAAPAVNKLERKTTGKVTKKIAKVVDDKLGSVIENGVNSLRYTLPV